MNTEPQSLVNIALQIGVHPSALSNWQKRYQDFPEPRQIKGQRRLYLLDDITEFVERHQLGRRDEQQPRRNVSPEETLIRESFNQLQSLFRLGSRALEYLAAIAFVRFEAPQVLERCISQRTLDIKASEGLLLRESLSIIEISLDGIPNEFLQMWRNRNQVDKKRLANALHILVQETSDNKFSGQFVTPPSIARLISKLVQGLEILDVCSGSGAILHEYHRGARRLVGQEINSSTAFIHEVIARLNDSPIEIYRENSLSNCHPEWMERGFDGVVCDAPMGVRLGDNEISSDDLRWTFAAQSRRNTAEDFWIQTVLAYLRPSFSEPGLRGVITLRAGWFFDSAEEQMRDALVKAGVIEAVISLGAGLLPSTGIPCGLLILRKSGVVNRPVRFVDASEAGRTVRGKRTLSHVEIDTIVNAVNGDWDQDSTSKVYVKDVSVAEIIANSASLQTSRYLTTEEIQLSVEDAINAFQSAKSDLEETLAAYKSAVEKSTQFQRYADSLSSDRPAEQVLVEALSRPNSPIDVLFKNRKAGEEWTRDDIFPDDVVINIAGIDIGKCVAGDYFLEAKLRWSRLWILRTKYRNVLPPYLNAWARYGGLQNQIRQMATGTTIPTLSKRDISQIRIPIPSLHTQEAISKWAESLQDREERFEKLTSAERVAMTSLKALFMAETNQVLKIQEGEEK